MSVLKKQINGEFICFVALNPLEAAKGGTLYYKDKSQNYLAHLNFFLDPGTSSFDEGFLEYVCEERGITREESIRLFAKPSYVIEGFNSKEKKKGRGTQLIFTLEQFGQINCATSISCNFAKENTASLLEKLGYSVHSSSLYSEYDIASLDLDCLKDLYLINKNGIISREYFS